MRPRSRRQTGVVTIRDPSGMLNLTGKWELDKDRSQSMYPHMKAMGCDEIASLASEQLNIMMNIVQKDGAITVWQLSQLGVTKRMLYIGKESMEKATDEVRKVWISAQDSEMTVDTKFKGGRLMDTRILQQEPDGTVALVTTLALSIRGKSGTIRTTRYFTRVGDPDAEVVKAHETAVASGELTPSITLSASEVRNQLRAKEAEAAKQKQKAANEAGKPPLAPSSG